MKLPGGSSKPVRAGEGTKIALVVSRWNDQVTSRLTIGAKQALLEAGLPEKSLDVFYVPGAFELPQAAQAIAGSGRYSAIVPLGCLIRGETFHFDLICQAVGTGLDAVGRSTGVPVTLGVLTVDKLEQAMDRAGGRYGNKGAEAALAALELVALKKDLSAS